MQAAGRPGEVAQEGLPDKGAFRNTAGVCESRDELPASCVEHQGPLLPLAWAALALMRLS